MNALHDTLTAVAEIVKKNRPLYEGNEEAVRHHIVNRILRSLGWNPEDPDEVRPNPQTEEGVPDYSLIKSERTVLFVEAKKLSVDVSQREALRQLARYSFGAGTTYGVLTNGAVWILIRSFEEGTTLTERIVWRADLENEALASFCRKMTTISRASVEQIDVLVRKNQILGDVWQSLLDQTDDVINALVPLVKSAAARAHPTYDFQDAEVEDLVREKVEAMVAPAPESVVVTRPDIEQHGPWVGPTTGGMPRSMKIEGDVFPIRHYFDIPVNTAEWLIRRGKLKASDPPVEIGNKRNLVSLQRKHRDGVAFSQPKQLSNGLWIETKFSADMHVKNARLLLQRFGYRPATLVID